MRSNTGQGCWDVLRERGAFGLKFKHAGCAGCRAGSERSGVELSGMGWGAGCVGGIKLCVPLNADEQKSEHRSSLVTHTVGRPSLDVVSPNTGRLDWRCSRNFAVANTYASQKPEAPPYPSRWRGGIYWAYSHPCTFL